MNNYHINGLLPVATGTCVNPPVYTFTGIKVENTNLSNSNLTIDQNHIYDTKKMGIRLINIKSASITNNQIYLPLSPPVGTNYGIYATYCANSTIGNNSVVWQLLSSPSSTNKQTGIAVEKSMGCNIDQNTLIRMGMGINMQDNCDQSQLTCNIMDNCYKGVHLSNSCKIPNQGSLAAPNDNEWFSIVGGNRITGAVITIADWYHKNTPNYFNINPYAASAVFDQPNASADLRCHVTFIPDSNPDREMLYGEIVVDSTQFSEFPDQNKYYEKSYTYDQMHNDTSIIYQGASTDTIYENFYNEIGQSNIGIFQDISSLIDSGDFATALVLNQSLIDTNVIEFNRKRVNDIYLVTFALGIYEFDSLQYATLFDIAHQNPITGGDAVYSARVMLNIEVETIEQFRWGQETALQKEAFILYGVYPNPARDNLTFDFEFDPYTTATLSIYNITGRIVSDYLLKGEEHSKTIFLTDLSYGVYQYRIIYNKSFVISNKFIVIK